MKKITLLAVAAAIGAWYYFTVYNVDHVLYALADTEIGSSNLHEADSMMHLDSYLDHQSDIRTKLELAIKAFNYGLDDAMKIEDYQTRHHYIDTCAKGRTNAEMTLSLFNSHVERQENMTVR